MAYSDQTRQKANDLATDARGAVEDAYEQYRPEIERYTNDITAAIRDKPLQSLAIAGAIAFALGALLKR